MAPPPIRVVLAVMGPIAYQKYPTYLDGTAAAV